MYLFWICNVPADQGAVQSLNRFTKQIRDAVKIEFLQSNPTNTSAWIIEARQSLIEHPFWQFFLVQKAIHVRKLSECSMRHSFPSFLCFILENRFNSPQKIGNIEIIGVLEFDSRRHFHRRICFNFQRSDSKMTIRAAEPLGETFTKSRDPHDAWKRSKSAIF